MAGVFFISTRTLEGIRIPVFLGADKIVHFVFYGLMVAFIAWGYYKLNLLNLSKLFFSAYWALLFGGLIELIQHFIVLGRSGELFDFIANSLGILFSSYIIFRKFLKRTTEN